MLSETNDHYSYYYHYKALTKAQHNCTEVSFYFYLIHPVNHPHYVAPYGLAIWDRDDIIWDGHLDLSVALIQDFLLFFVGLLE